MQANVTWVEDVCFMAESSSGHSLVMDGSAEAGGRNAGFRPMELLLIGTAGCTSFDVISILKKSRQKIRDCKVSIEAKRAEQVPHVFTKIHLHFKVSGIDLKHETVAKAIDLSADKYCSASIMLGKTASITHSFEVLNVED